MSEARTIYRILATRADGEVRSYHTDYPTLETANAKARQILDLPNCIGVEVVTGEVPAAPEPYTVDFAPRAVILNDQFFVSILRDAYLPRADD